MRIVLYGLATFAVIFGGGLLGLLFGKLLPEEYRSDATQRIVPTARLIPLTQVTLDVVCEAGRA
jgi:hypothetical protein